MSGLCFLPLGGCAEIGMNLNAYGYGPAGKRSWLIVDVGVTFGNEHTPGIDLIMPDPSFLSGEDIRGIVLTHAHEDHIGAIAHLWEFLRAPIYASAFTSRLVERKLSEEGLTDKAVLHVFSSDDRLDLHPFEISYVPLNHSIPEMNALAIRTPLGCVFHTGDWKIDPGPVIGESVNEQALQALGEEGVLAMVCDSTNVFVEGEAGSESEVQENLVRIVGELEGRVAVTGFASNVARLSSVCEAASRSGRKVALAGRSMERIVSAARSVGLLLKTEFISPEKAGKMDRDKVLYLCTGSQGEPRAALARLAQDSYPGLRMEDGDTVIFSSRVIPGNEKAIAQVQNALATRGIRLITESQELVHVSGHPCRDELARMYGWIRPQISIPVHGERRHCLEHANFAKSLQVKQSLAPENGEMVQLAPGPARIIDKKKAGRLILDGNVLTPLKSTGMSERRRIARSGHIVVVLAVDEDGRLAGGPELKLRGYSESDGTAAQGGVDILYEAADRALQRMTPNELMDDNLIGNKLRQAIRRATDRVFGKRPMIDVMTLRVG